MLHSTRPELRTGNLSVARWRAARRALSPASHPPSTPAGQLRHHSDLRRLTCAATASVSHDAPHAAGGESARTAAASSAPPPPVHYQVHVACPGADPARDTVAVVGGAPELGGWSLMDGELCMYNPADGSWVLDLWLPLSSVKAPGHMEFRVVWGRGSDGSVTMDVDTACHVLPMPPTWPPSPTDTLVIDCSPTWPEHEPAAQEARTQEVLARVAHSSAARVARVVRPSPPRGQKARALPPAAAAAAPAHAPAEPARSPSPAEESAVAPARALSPKAASGRGTPGADAARPGAAAASPAQPPAPPVHVPVLIEVVGGPMDAAGKLQLRLVGESPALGAWVPSKGVQLTPTEGGVWHAHASLPLPDLLHGVKAKLVCMRGHGGSEVEWEQGHNRIIKFAEGCEPVLAHGSDVAPHHVAMLWKHTPGTGPAVPIASVPPTPVTVKLEAPGGAATLPGGGHAAGRFMLVGDTPELGSWRPEAGVQLTPVACPESRDGRCWIARLTIPPGQVVQYKLVWVEGGGWGVWVGGAAQQVVWEEGANRRLLGRGSDVPLEPISLTWRGSPSGSPPYASGNPAGWNVAAPIGTALAALARAASSVFAPPVIPERFLTEEQKQKPVSDPSERRTPTRRRRRVSAPDATGPLGLVHFSVSMDGWEGDGDVAEVRVVGNHAALGSWEPASGLILTRAGSDDPSGPWVGAALLPASGELRVRLVVARGPPGAGSGRKEKRRGRRRSSKTKEAEEQPAASQATYDWEPLEADRVLEVTPNSAHNMAAWVWGSASPAAAQVGKVLVDLTVPGQALAPGQCLCVRELPRGQEEEEAARQGELPPTLGVFQLQWSPGHTWRGSVHLPAHVLSEGIALQLLVCGRLLGSGEVPTTGPLAVLGTEPGSPHVIQAPVGEGAVVRLGAEMAWGEGRRTRTAARIVPTAIIRKAVSGLPRAKASQMAKEALEVKPPTAAKPRQRRGTDATASPAVPAFPTDVLSKAVVGGSRVAAAVEALKPSRSPRSALPSPLPATPAERAAALAAAQAAPRLVRAAHNPVAQLLRQQVELQRTMRRTVVVNGSNALPVSPGPPTTATDSWVRRMAGALRSIGDGFAGHSHGAVVVSERETDVEWVLSEVGLLEDRPETDVWQR